MSKKLNIAIVGATGVVGEAFITILQERNFPIDKLYPLASSRSTDKHVVFNNQEISIQNLADFDFNLADIALFSAGSDVALQYAPKAVKEGCIVIDNSSCYRYEEDIPLIVPEVNGHELSAYENRGIIANPNCSTIQLVVALKPLHDAVGIERINIATYQAVSGTGREAISELIEQTTELLNGRPAKTHVYNQQIAFNVFPHIDEFLDNGYTREEMKLVWETKKILGDSTLRINATTVRVPVLYGHSEAVNVEFKSPLSADSARKLLKRAPGISVIDNPLKLKYPTPFKDAIGKDEVFVGRIREDLSHPNGLNLWIVADNVRKGAATNAIQIAEMLQKDYL